VPISLASSMMLAAVLAGPPGKSPPPSSVPPGGYWTLADQHGRSEPPDGDDELTLGAVLLPLGAIRAGAAGLTLWMADNPEFCPINTPERCNGMRIYGWVGIGEGILMSGTGLAYLIIGASRRAAHERWKGGRISQRFGVSPWMLGRTRAGSPAGGGLMLSLRF
jgi:hypothetical protein